MVPITFALHADQIVTAVDHKPKRHSRLQRLANIESNPAVSVLIDHWDSDWSDLWRVRLDGRASVLDSDADAVAALIAKYAQYRDQPPSGPVIRVTITRTVRWDAVPPDE